MPASPTSLPASPYLLEQVVGEHTLLFAGPTEHIALTHRAFDRRVFATGAIRAATWAQGRPPGLYAMRDVMA